ncbi:MAG: hypothetical protein KGJ06_07865 [Pseudomonadota bacterium]|nr:hypothetical protein [Pseudomonadota bacterium]
MFSSELEAFRRQLKHFQDGTARNLETISKLNSVAMRIRFEALRERVKSPDLVTMKSIAEEAMVAVTEWNEALPDNKRPHVTHLRSLIGFCDKRLQEAAADFEKRRGYAR